MFRTNLRGRGTPTSVKVTTLALAFILLGIYIHPVLADDGERGSHITETGSAIAAGLSDNGHNAYYPSDGDHDSYGPGGGDDSYGPGGESKSRGRTEKDKLPFRTGSIVRLVSPWLDYACDTATDPAPYGPYGPGGDDSYSPDGDHGSRDDSWWIQRRMLRDVNSDGSMGRKVSLGGNGKGKSYPYGPDDDDDLAKGVVWCNVTITDNPPQPYLSEARSKDQAGNGNGGFVSSWLDPILSAFASAGAAAFSRATAKHMDDVAQLSGSGSSGGAVKGSQWDLDGFVLMGTDFRTPYVFSGGRVFLKNQNSRKFCRLADDDDDDGDFGLPSATVVCDEMTSSAKTEFVVEMVDEVKEDEEAGRSHVMDSSAAQRDAKLEGYGPSDGDWPSGRDGGKGDRPDGGGPDSGNDLWPGRGGKNGKKTSVMIRLRAPQNDMRYCGPDRRIRGSPLICDMRHPDTSHRRLTDFKLTDATPARASSASI